MNPITKNEAKKSKTLLSGYKEQLSSLTEHQYQVAIGVLLGDASLHTQDGGKTYRLKFEQGNIHKDYIDHLYEIFDEWCLSLPASNERINKNDNTIQNWTFQTISHSAFVPLAEIFFSTDSPKKRIEDDFVEKHLTPCSLAYWFMDDGGKMDYGKNEGKGIVYNTHGFSHDEVKALCSGLAKKFKLECWPKKNKKKYIVAISGKCYEQMIDLIGSLVIPSLQSKLPSPRRPRKKKTDDIV